MKAQLKRGRSKVWIWRIVDDAGKVLESSFGTYPRKDLCRTDAKAALRVVRAAHSADGWVDA